MTTNIFNSVGYRYNPGSSTMGIIFNDPKPFLFTWDPLKNVKRLLFDCPEGDRPEDVTACYSSRGLAAFHETKTNLYYIGNPLVPRSYAVLPPTPRPHHPRKNTHVVYATAPQHSCYYLICATRDAGPSNYIFDTYTNNEGYEQWQLYEQTNLRGYEIKPNSGVSCSRFTFWLAETPGMVLAFDVETELLAIFKGPNVKSEVLDHPETRLQLGRVGKNYLGLVLVSGTDRTVELHTLNIFTFDEVLLKNWAKRQENKITVLVFGDFDATYMQRSAAAMNWDFKVGRYLGCTKLPHPVRFESYKMEVPLWVGKHLVLWQQKDGDDFRTRRIVHLRRGAEFCMANGFAHVHTRSTPRDFLDNDYDQGLMDEDEGDDDQEMNEDHKTSVDSK